MSALELTRRQFIGTAMAAVPLMAAGAPQTLLSPREVTKVMADSGPAREARDTPTEETTAMKIEQTTYGPWKQAWRCTLDAMEMIVLTEVGPRIMSLRVNGGENVLFNDLEGKLGMGDWKIRGGHRCWVSPETKVNLAADDDPCEARVQDGRLIVSGPPLACGLQKIMEIGPSPRKGAFRVRHTLLNASEMLASGGIWALTCLRPTGRIVVPWSEGSEGWDTPMVRFWRKWAGEHATDIESKQWHLRNGYFMIEPTGEEGKAGLGTRHGTMAQLLPGATFVKAVDTIPDASFPDGGCNVELYTCEHFMEMESLGPCGVIAPGQRVTHDEHWLLTDKTFEPAQWPEFKALMG